jgi:hypothetical protein
MKPRPERLGAVQRHDEFPVADGVDVRVEVRRERMSIAVVPEPERSWWVMGPPSGSQK